MRGSIVRAGMVLSCVALLGSQTAARADDIGDFFSRAFGLGGGGHEQSYDAPMMDEPVTPDRPLVVRPHHRRPKIAKAEVPKGPVGPVSIYEDRTLRRGDAVMTAQGIRIFKGSDSLPYRDNDFVAVSDADGLSKPVAKALLAIDRLPRT